MDLKTATESSFYIFVHCRRCWELSFCNVWGHVKKFMDHTGRCQILALLRPDQFVHAIIGAWCGLWNFRRELNRPVTEAARKSFKLSKGFMAEIISFPDMIISLIDEIIPFHGQIVSSADKIVQFPDRILPLIYKIISFPDKIISEKVLNVPRNFINIWFRVHLFSFIVKNISFRKHLISFWVHLFSLKVPLFLFRVRPISFRVRLSSFQFPDKWKKVSNINSW